MKRMFLILLVVVLVLPLTAAGQPAGENFTVRGRTQHWDIFVRFAAADFQDPVGESTIPGYEFWFSLTYRGPTQRIRWYRVEPLLPDPITLRDQPGAPLRRGPCTADVHFSAPGGPEIRAGQSYQHGRCSIYPWTGTGQDLAELIGKGVFLVAWEDEAGVHAEPLRVRR